MYLQVLFPEISLDVEKLKAFQEFFSSLGWVTYVGIMLILAAIILPRMLAAVIPSGSPLPGSSSSAVLPFILFFSFLTIGFCCITCDANIKRELRIKASNVKSFIIVQDWEVATFPQIRSYDSSISEVELRLMAREFDKDFILINAKGNVPALRLVELTEVRNRIKIRHAFYRGIIKSYLEKKARLHLMKHNGPLQSIACAQELRDSAWYQLTDDMIKDVYVSDTSAFYLLSEFRNGEQVICVAKKRKIVHRKKG